MTRDQVAAAQELTARVAARAVTAAAEAEREACAALCEEIARDHGALGAVATLCALKIRARGNVRLP